MGARKPPKRSQNPQKVGPKLDQKTNLVLDRFFIGFWLIFGAKIDRNLIKNQDPQAYQSKKDEGCKVL